MHRIRIELTRQAFTVIPASERPGLAKTRPSPAIPFLRVVSR